MKIGTTNGINIFFRDLYEMTTVVTTSRSLIPYRTMMDMYLDDLGKRSETLPGEMKREALRKKRKAKSKK